jgi:hypothetical protein
MLNVILMAHTIEKSPMMNKTAISDCLDKVIDLLVAVAEVEREVKVNNVKIETSPRMLKKEIFQRGEKTLNFVQFARKNISFGNANNSRLSLPARNTMLPVTLAIVITASDPNTIQLTAFGIVMLSADLKDALIIITSYFTITRVQCLSHTKNM